MTILDRFDEDPRFKLLARRRNNFKFMLQHCIDFAEKNGHCRIIETGSAWDHDNWDGQGQSTLIWDWFIEQGGDKFSALSIDITPSSTEHAKANSKHVDFVTADSVMTLNSLLPDYFEKVGALYLDSYDWTPELNLQSSFHHIAELTACWRMLPSGCVVVVDDRHGNGKGKHWLVESFMSDYLKLNPVFKNHQIGFIKP